jgi:Ca2+/H+ antiporter
MTTAAVSQGKYAERTGQRDRRFFSGIALLVLIAVSAGFARTYFLAGAFWAKLPSAMVHVHGALFTLWIALLVAQVALVASRHTGWHMRLGIAGMFLAPLMVITGFATLIGAIKRSAPTFVLQIITAQDILLLCLFAFLISWAFLARRDAPTHKRLVLCATFVIIIPAIARWPIVGNIAQNPVPFYVFVNSFPVLLVVYDLWTRRSLHRATIWGVGLMTALQLAVLPLSRTALIGQTIAWLQRT